MQSPPHTPPKRNNQGLLEGHGRYLVSRFRNSTAHFYIDAVSRDDHLDLKGASRMTGNILISILELLYNF